MTIKDTREYTRRSFLAKTAALGVASALPFSLTACGGSEGVSGAARAAASVAQPDGLTLTAFIDGEAVSRAEVLTWEARRLQVVAKRMSNNLPAAIMADLEALILRPALSTANIAQEREQLADAKLLAGDEQMQALVAGDLLLSDQASELAAMPGQWAVSQIEIESSLGTAEGFADWFSRALARDDERAMLVACPDHYLIRSQGTQGQNVIEETGGALVVSHFVVDYTKPADLPYAIDPEFPVRLTGPAMNEAGTQIGGVCHQFRNLEQGFRLRPAVFFPAMLPFWTISEHRWHLACEFENWVTAYVREMGLEG